MNKKHINIKDSFDDKTKVIEGIIENNSIIEFCKELQELLTKYRMAKHSTQKETICSELSKETKVCSDFLVNTFDYLEDYNSSDLLDTRIFVGILRLNSLLSEANRIIYENTKYTTVREIDDVKSNLEKKVVEINDKLSNTVITILTVVFTISLVTAAVAAIPTLHNVYEVLLLLSSQVMLIIMTFITVDVLYYNRYNSYSNTIKAKDLRVVICGIIIIILLSLFSGHILEVKDKKIFINDNIRSEYKQKEADE